jgi:glycosyltransferase involved in cell wall biosynthesis
MNIYVDGMFFLLSGIGRIYENVLRALIEADGVQRITTVVPDSRKRKFQGMFSSPRLDSRFVPYEQGSWEEFFLKGWVIGRFRPKPDLYYFPNFYAPFFFRGEYIVNINDLIPLYPFYDIPEWKKKAVRFLLWRSLRNAAGCVCISRFTREEVTRMFRCDEKKLSIIHPWIDEGFLEKANRAPEDEPRAVEGDYLLFVGNRFVHKNLGTIVRAFGLLIRDFPRLRLVVAGARMRRVDDVDITVRDFGLEEKVIEMENPPDAVVRNLYRHAKAFVFPSLVEGFGIPPLEAMAYGVPVVCSDIPVIKEVCGDTVRYADPCDPASFAAEIRGVFSDPKAEQAIRKGKERVRLYRRETALKQYLDLFRKCIETRTG